MEKFFKIKSSINKSLFVSGITRSGKIVLCKILSSFKGVQNIKLSYELELILSLYKSKKINKETCGYLFDYILNLQNYNSFIGRNINLRIHDYTSIWKSHNPRNYLRRLSIKENEKIFKKINKNNEYFQLMIHNGLIYSRLILENFPKTHIFHMRKHPVDLVFSWIKKDICNDFLKNRRNSLLTYQYKKHLIPWYAKSWKDKYVKLNKTEKVIHLINFLRKNSLIEFKKLSNVQKKRVHFVDFDNLVTNTNVVVKEIARKLNLKQTKFTKRVFVEENCMRKIDHLDRKKKLDFIRKKISKKSFNLLISMSKNFETKIESI